MYTKFTLRPSAAGIPTRKLLLGRFRKSYMVLGSSIPYSSACSLSAHHAAIDGRSGFMVLDQLLTFLRDELGGSDEALSRINWGEEVCRLPVAADVVWSMHEKGQPDEPAEPTSMHPPAPEGEVCYTHAHL